MSLQTIARSSRCLSSAAPSLPLYTQKRLLSSSPSSHAIGPESPRYIEVPEPLQTPKAPLKPVKGILPIPRQILNKRREHKATPEWISQATPKPSSSIDLSKVPPHLRERTEYKQRMAEMRRTSLKEGITELYNRVVETEQRTDTSKERQLLRDMKALNAPARHDDTWTKLSVSKAIREALRKKSPKPNVSEGERAARKVEVDQRVQSRVDDRLQSLHSLYLHAKDFIVNEKQLDEQINKVFGSEDLPMTWAGGRKSVWTLGNPAGTSEMIGFKPRGASDSRMQAQTLETNQMMKERMMRIAGQLTGGKIRIPDEIKKRESNPYS